MEYYAHTKENKGKEEWQKLRDHLENTAELAKAFGGDANIGELAYIAAWFHDLGKYSREFQDRLEGKNIRVDHATAGAQELHNLLDGTLHNLYATLLAYVISGHHGGLLDYGDISDVEDAGTLAARLKKQLCDFSAYREEVDLKPILMFPKYLHVKPLRLNLISQNNAKLMTGFTLSFLIRMIYSALVDADFQETETHMQGKKPRGEYEDILTLRNKFNIYIQRFDNPNSEINRKRTETLHACVKGAEAPPGFFTLTVPTGGGKTLASMAFALNHAVTHDLRRIIYVIPYTTIIEQNAAEFKNILGEENILEHHANFDWEQRKKLAGEDFDNLTNSVYAKLKLAAENWDIPIVVTTNVQFFESLFANKSSRCRKLHNIARSVIIFDEAQMLPRGYMLPAMSAIWELVTNYGTTAVFCTATQPDLGRFLPAGTKLTELAPNPQELFDFYKRVEVKNLGELTDEELLHQLNSYKQVLCILNTRRHASGIYSGLSDGKENFHLSTLMCPVHRKLKLIEIRDRLKKGLSCRVVSTTVMEAGVDLDFFVGYRAISGLDSINQAAGRVNRNMKYGLSNLFLFEPKSEFVKRLPSYVSQSAAVTRRVIRDYPENVISIPAVQSYFDQLYSLHDPTAFDIKQILRYFDNDYGRYQFQTAAKMFYVIEQETFPVIIPYDEEANRLIEELKYTPYPSSVLRKLQPYTVSIYKNELDALSIKGVILTLLDTYSVLNPDSFKEYYDHNRGLMIPASVGGEGLFF